MSGLGVKPGDRVRVERDDGLIIEGILLPRPGFAGEEYLSLKLDNGYNIGLKVSRIKSIAKIGEAWGPSKPGEPAPLAEHFTVDEKHRIMVIGTGGTIASRIDYETGAVAPRLSVKELAEAIPEAFKYGSIDVEALLNILSENMKPRHWAIIAETVYNALKKGYDGVVVVHGTDTMGYTAAALSFAFHKGLNAPVALVGSQRSSDRPSSDAAFNFTSAVFVASRAPFAEVTVVMHGETGDSYALAHRGTRVRKMHTSRRDAFQSVNAPPLARVYPFKGDIEVLDNRFRGRGEQEPLLDNGFHERVALLKFFPGAASEILEHVLDAGFQGIVLEGTGFGHVDDETISVIKKATRDGVPVVIASQTIFGRVNLNVYATGRRMLEAGAIPVDDMLAETAYVKLSWVLARARDIDEAKRLMLTPLAHELGERHSLRLYPRWDHEFKEGV